MFNPDWYKTPGIYDDIPEAEYHSQHLLSSSGLAAINKSPKHFGVPITSSSFGLGSLVHCMILEPDKLDANYFVPPKIDGRTKEGKLAKKELKSDPRTIISVLDWDKALDMRMSANLTTDVRDALSKMTRAELTLVWEERGVMCKARLDGEVPTGALDLKTSRDASRDGFSRAIWQYCYDQQAAHYHAGMAALGMPAETWEWVVIENTEPFIAVRYVATQELLIRGRERRDENFNKYLDCMFSGDWYGYEGGFIDLPKWTRKSGYTSDE